MTVPARRPEDDAIDRLAAYDLAATSHDLDGNRIVPAYIVDDLIVALPAVREALERQQSRIYILENMRSENYIEALESAEAEVRQLREELRQARAYIDSIEQR